MVKASNTMMVVAFRDGDCAGAGSASAGLGAVIGAVDIGAAAAGEVGENLGSGAEGDFGPVSETVDGGGISRVTGSVESDRPSGGSSEDARDSALSRSSVWVCFSLTLRLLKGEAVPDSMVAQMINDKINSPEVIHHGITLDYLLY